jgi:hypothetical protein
VGIAREAGASVATKEQLAGVVVQTFLDGARGVLKVPVLSAGEWAKAWRESLI